MSNNLSIRYWLRQLDSLWMQHLNVKSNRISYVIKHFFLLIFFNINIFHIDSELFSKILGWKFQSYRKVEKTVEYLSLISSSGVTHCNILPHLLYLTIYTHTHTNAHTHTHLPTVRSICVLQVNFCGVIRQGYINSSIGISTGFSTIFLIKKYCSPNWITLASLPKTSWPHMCKFIFGLSIFFFSFICSFIFMPVPCCLDYYHFIINPEIRILKLVLQVFFFLSCFGILYFSI